MRHRVRLPRRLGERFSVRSAEAAGIRPGRYSAPDLHRPFRGVRSLEKPETFDDYVRCYVLRLKPGQRLGGFTAARDWGMPMPTEWDPSEPIDVIVPSSGAVPNAAGVKGRRLRDGRAETRILKGRPVIDPVATLFTCAKDLTVPQAITMIDALLTTASNYPDLGPGRPMATRDEIIRRLAEWGRFPGSGTIRAALPHARDLVESPKETETRLLLIANGLPEPVIQHEVWAGGVLLGRTDLAYPEWKIAIEYEGDGHRTDKDQWRKDIQRQRYLESQGWIVLRLTQADLEAEDLLITSIHRVIAERRG
ncbi:endonuclease domain-containing protein [Microbacterium sp.]|uniref:endonuclease domain-containing protein n=1 Tax=Microbacterium sp. TaxID=51671 RepID=UPI003F9728CB